MKPNRRRILCGLTAMVVAGPGWSLAQTAVRPARKRVAVCLFPSTEPDPIGPPRKTWAKLLARHGFVDGKDIEISIIRATNHDFTPDSVVWHAIAQEVVASRPDVIVVHMTWLKFFTRLTQDIPIVFTGTLDLEQHAGIGKPGQPGRNVTGVASLFFEIQEKRFELLKELRPEARRIGVVCSDGGTRMNQLLEDRLKASARRLGMEGEAILVGDFASVDSIAKALRKARVAMADFICCLSRPSADQRALFGRLAEQGVASSVPFTAPVRNGCLLAYSAVFDPGSLPGMVARILRGEAVATIPTEQPREFRLAINLRTAKALGITVPASVTLMANEVFE